MADDLLNLLELNENPFGFDINELNSGEDVKSTLSSNNACWHKSSQNRINSTGTKMVEKQFNLGTTR